MISRELAQRFIETQFIKFSDGLKAVCFTDVLGSSSIWKLELRKQPGSVSA